MAEYFSYYTLTEEEKTNILKTCETLKKLKGNDKLNSTFHFSFIEQMLEIVISNNNNKLRI